MLKNTKRFHSTVIRCFLKFTLSKYHSLNVVFHFNLSLTGSPTHKLNSRQKLRIGVYHVNMCISVQTQCPCAKNVRSSQDKQVSLSVVSEKEFW